MFGNNYYLRKDVFADVTNGTIIGGSVDENIIWLNEPPFIWTEKSHQKTVVKAIFSIDMRDSIKGVIERGERLGKNRFSVACQHEHVAFETGIKSLPVWTFVLPLESLQKVFNNQR